MTVTLELSQLPPPKVVEELSYETILAAMRADLFERFPQYSADLASDPVNKLLEVVAYRELLLRQRTNDAARSNLLAFASGTDLDHLASFYGVRRLTVETDAGFRLRVQQRIQGWANAGGAAHYRYWALSSDQRVVDAAVSSPAPGVVRIAVLASDNDGRADADLLAAVRQTVLRDDVRVLTDTVEVMPANILTVDVVATVFLYPDTPAAVMDQIRTAFPAMLNATRGLGWDLTRTWITAHIHPHGVQRVELQRPTLDTIAGPSDCVALGAFELVLGGRDR
jgi:phage-related baseplate assembly protein